MVAATGKKPELSTDLIWNIGREFMQIYQQAATDPHAEQRQLISSLFSCLFPNSAGRRARVAKGYQHVGISNHAVTCLVFLDSGSMDPLRLAVSGSP